VAAGACKDRLADAIARYGRVPIHCRDVVAEGEHPAFRRPESAPLWAAGGLVHDGKDRVLLLRHDPASWWGTRWLTPGGTLEEGETTVDGLRREVMEEVGLEIDVAWLTRIFNNTLRRGVDVRHTYFAQFVARARPGEPVCGPDVVEVRWFGELPVDMSFRDDYLEDFRGLRSARY